MDGNNRWSKKIIQINIMVIKKVQIQLIKLSNFIFENTDAKYISAFALSKNNLKDQKINIILKKILLEFLNKAIE